MPAVLVLGASSGFGAAVCRTFARAGFDVIGVHLDRRSTLPAAEAVMAEVRALGRECTFFNENAADEEVRARICDSIGPVQVLVHSLAFGTLQPFTGEKPLRPAQMSMTMEVMAHSLVWWTRDLVARDKLSAGGSVFAMTSSGSLAVIPSYGAVSAAKSALESHVRQLAVELAPRRITVNSIMAGVTDTPALRKIPGSDLLIKKALDRNPHGRLTTPEDAAEAMLALSGPGGRWITGSVIHCDGGETIAG